MKRPVFAGPLSTTAACCVIAVLLGGCGSDGGEINYDTFASAPSPSPFPSPVPVPNPSPAAVSFAGQWAGDLLLNTRETGVAEITVAADGRVTGRVISTTAGSLEGEEGPLNGTIGPDGNAELTLRYDGRTFTVTGRLRIDAGPKTADDRLRGTLFREVNGQNLGSVAVDLVRGPLLRF